MKKFCKNIKWYLGLKIAFSFVLFLLIITLEFVSGFSESKKIEGNVILIFAIIFLLLIIVTFFLCFGYASLYYKYSGYKISDNKIECFHGVLFKKHSVLDFSKINAVNIKQGLIQQIFNVATVTIDSGSTNTASTAEITIFETKQNATNLMNLINKLKDGENACSDVEANLSLDETINENANQNLMSFYKFKSKSKLLYSLISIVTTTIYFLLIAIILGIFIDIFVITGKFLLENNPTNIFVKAILNTVSIILFLAIGSIIFTFIGSIINAFVGYYDFKISIDNSKNDKNAKEVIVEYGLFVRNCDRFKVNKIRGIRVKQNLISKLFGFCSIWADVVGLTSSQNGNENNYSAGQLVPFCKVSDINEILKNIDPRFCLCDMHNKPKKFLPFVSWILIFYSIALGFITFIAAVVLFKFVDVKIGLLVLFILFGIYLLGVISILCFGYIKYKITKCAINLDNRTIVLRHGSLFFETFIVKADDLIGIDFVTTYHRKLKHIYTYIIHFFSNQSTNTVKIENLDELMYEDIKKLIKF